MKRPVGWSIAIAIAACSSAQPAPDRPAVAGGGAPDRAAVAPGQVGWLKGSTHVHALPSGDSTTPIAQVIAWYERHGYDFIVLTDHNRVSEVDASTPGQVAVRAGPTGLIVLAGIELTHNPGVCVPPPPELDGKCRIHVNAIGVTARPEGKLEWAERKSDRRVDMYAKALATSTELGGLAQLNHAQWQWGMTPDLLTELGRRGYRLVEISNKQFERWMVGSDLYPSMESLWDAALVAGVDMWGVATDDAHDYREDGGGQYPAGGAWVVVRAARDPESIKAALAAGRFYSSTGVTLSRAEREADDLVVEVDSTSPGEHAIAFIANGKLAQVVAGSRGRFAIPAGGYVRAVVRRIDGALAWVQPARR